MTKKFTFIFPLMQRQPDLHRASGSCFNHVADFEISGVVNVDREVDQRNERKYDYRILRVLYNGMDVFPLTDALNNLQGLEAAVDNHLDSVFASPVSPVVSMRHSGGKLISLHTNRKVRGN